MSVALMAGLPVPPVLGTVFPDAMRDPMTAPPVSSAGKTGIPELAGVLAWAAVVASPGSRGFGP